MSGRACNPGAACGDGRYFRSAHQQAHKQEGWHRQQGIRRDA